MYDDKKRGLLFPTRTGTPAGGANERSMLDRIGSGGFRKDFRTNLDGSTTMLTTKNGMPQFSTSAAPGAGSNLAEQKVYLESGQLRWSYPGISNPTRFDAAEWRFTNISEAESYLGYINPNTGAQDNYPPLSEGSESRAVGPRKVKRNATFTGVQNSVADEADAATKAEDGPNTMMKKLIVGMFPPSVFTGKMRLFMQAQYGALQELFPLSVEVLGESALLFYQNGADRLQLGFWGHLTPGIFTAPDGTYWLINITSGATVSYYPITHNPEVDALVTTLRTGGMSDDERAKVEAYVFAHSKIDIVSRKVIGSVPTAIGAPMAYGWKFSRSGERAGIILHEGLNPGTTTERWKSRTVMLNFSYSAGEVSMSPEVTDNGNWIDGWGTHILWGPPDERSTSPLSMFSIKGNGGAVAVSFNFTGVPIYGYFRGETWVQATVTYSALTGFPIYRQGDVGITYDASVNLSAPTRYTAGAYPATSSWSYWEETISGGGTTDLTFDGGTFSGEALSGTFGYVTSATSAPGAEIPPYLNFAVPALGGSPPNGELPPDYPDDISPDRFPLSGSYVGSKRSTITRNYWTITGVKAKAWAFVVPAGDCEAAYVATNERLVPTSVSHTTDVMTEKVTTIVAYSETGVRYEWVPWQNLIVPPGWFGDGGTTISTTDSDPPSPNQVLVYCYNTEVSGAAGTPGGSYEPLFSVDFTYPYYARGMYTFTSYGGRYVMSEMSAAVPTSVSYSDRFVGWA